MIQMFRIMNGFVRLDINTLFSPTKISHTRGHSQRVFKNHAFKFPRANSSTQRAINDWNNLPNDMVNASSLNTFKNRLDKFWKDIYYDISTGSAFFFVGNIYYYYKTFP